VQARNLEVRVIRVLMQQAIDPNTDTSGLYEIAEIRESAS